MKNRIIDELNLVATLFAAVWGFHILNWALGLTLNNWGLVPRSAMGLVGIATMPFLHANWEHLLSNSMPLFILLCLLAGARANSYVVVPQLIALGGGLLWLFGRTAMHIGASGLVYALIAFLIISGFREKRVPAILMSLLVGFLYGATLLGGVLPATVGENVSWDGHLLGAVAGAITAFTTEPSERSLSS